MKRNTADRVFQQPVRDAGPTHALRGQGKNEFETSCFQTTDGPKRPVPIDTDHRRIGNHCKGAGKSPGICQELKIAFIPSCGIFLAPSLDAFVSL